MLPYDDLFAAMNRDLERCWCQPLPLMISIELSFRISEQYNQRLADRLADHSFQDARDEIDFFKNIQPQFLAESAYYCLLNYAHNFCPSDSNERIAFWKRQADRLGKFKVKNPLFYQYHNSNSTESDNLYYRQPLPGNFPKLLGDLWARERFAIYAQEQVQNT